jgi:hypothetical protein
MLKKVRLLTRPAPARQDAPFRGQGRMGECSFCNVSHFTSHVSRICENAAGGLFQHPANRDRGESHHSPPTPPGHAGPHPAVRLVEVSRQVSGLPSGRSSSWAGRCAASWRSVSTSGARYRATCRAASTLAPRRRISRGSERDPSPHHRCLDDVWALTTRAARSRARSPCPAPPPLRFVCLDTRCSLHASSPRSVTLAQLRVTSLAVVSSREDLHLQDRAHAWSTSTKAVGPYWTGRLVSSCLRDVID